MRRTTIAKRAKSKKRSDTKASDSVAKPLESWTFFLDRSIEANSLVEALRSRGLNVVRHKDRFQPAASDVEWLAIAGQKGWVAFTRDQNIRIREIERRALISAKLRTFVFTGGSISGQELVDAVVKALPRIQHILSKHEPPFICRITALGNVEMIVTRGTIKHR